MVAKTHRHRFQLRIPKTEATLKTWSARKLELSAAREVLENRFPVRLHHIPLVLKELFLSNLIYLFFM